MSWFWGQCGKSTKSFLYNFWISPTIMILRMWIEELLIIFWVSLSFTHHTSRKKNAYFIIASIIHTTLRHSLAQ
jgi:hypothetical protein